MSPARTCRGLPRAWHPEGHTCPEPQAVRPDGLRPQGAGPNGVLGRDDACGEKRQEPFDKLRTGLRDPEAFLTGIGVLGDIRHQFGTGKLGRKKKWAG